MADDLLDAVAQTYPINLDDMVEALPQPSSRTPTASIRNQAALTSLLSDDPSKIESNFQNMMVEGEQGKSYTRDTLVTKAQQHQSVQDRQGLMSLLSDPAVSLEMKQEAIKNLSLPFTKDTATIVATEAAKQASKGENHEQEDVRIYGAEQFKAVREAQEAKQTLLNKKMASLNSSTGSLAGDVAEAFLAPGATNKMGFGVLHDILTTLDISFSKTKSTFAPGQAKKAIRDKLASIPAADRMAVNQKIADIIYNTPNIIYQNDNAFAKMTLANELLTDGGYGTVEQWLDNTVGILDIIGIGSLAKTGVKKLTSLFTKTPENTVANIELRSITSTVSPVSTAKVLEASNPDKARSIYEMVVKSSGDEVAKAVTGTSRDDAIVSMHVPQPLARDGSVDTRLVDPDRNLRTIVPDEPLVREWEDTGALWFSDANRKQVGTQVYHDFTNVKGITPLDNMTTVGVEGQQVVVKAMYGTSEGGFLLADDAIDQVKFALREYGIADRDLTLMKKVASDYVPITLEEARGVKGDYVVQLNTKHKMNAFDITEWDKETVKRNWFDKIPYFRTQHAGTLANTILDNASMLSPRISGAAVVQADKAVRFEKLFIQLHDEFASGYKQLDKGRQAKLYEHIKEANALGIELNTNQLLARGFVQKEIDLLHTWRRNWDTHFWFENADLISTLSHQGFQVFDDVASGTKFFAKPVRKNQNIAKAYDNASNKIVNLTQQEMDALYASGGTYAQFRRPININGVNVEHMIVRNTPTEYLRGLREFDQALDYRKGHYSVQYKAPKFITEIVRDASGAEEYRKAIAVAGDTQEANQIRKRLAAAQGKDAEKDFVIRDDIKDMRVDTDAYWDLQTGSGRSAQRHRGKRLEDSSAPQGSFDSQYILDPVDSALRASRSISGRIANRDFLEVTKKRALEQYGDYFPSDGRGGRSWVENSNSLVPTTSKFSSDIADARTTVEYVNYLQHGYINGFDEGFKGVMNSVANMLTSVPTAERTFLWLGQTQPTNFLKNGVFQAYLALNPLRQIIIQGHQAVRILGYNPSYIASGQSAVDGMSYWLYASGMRDLSLATKEERAFYDFVKTSGMLDAVDKQNLVRGSLTQMSESYNKGTHLVGEVLAVPRKLGFDTGEQSQLLQHLGAVRAKFISQGRNMADPAVRDEAYSVARAMTYDMNFAGDLPYNQNALGLFMQFFQVPHKAFLSVTNRRIPVGDRMRLAVSDLMLFGIPGAAVIERLTGKEMLPKDEVAKQSVLFGLTSVGYNAALSRIAGKDVKVDFSSLSPLGIDGFAHLAHAVVSGGMLEYVQNSPAFSLYLKEGSRVQEAFGRMFRYFGFIDTQAGLEKEDLLSVAKGVAEISSGWSNANKAYMIYKLGKIPDKKNGEPIMNDADSMYALAQLFGFKSQKEVFEWAAIKEMNQNQKDREADYKEVYNSYIRILTRDERMKITDPEAVVKVLGAVKLMYGQDDFKAQEWFAKQLSRDMVSRKDSLMRNIIESGNFVNADQSMTNTRNLGHLSDDEYNNALQLFNDMQTQINKQKDEK